MSAESDPGDTTSNLSRRALLAGSAGVLGVAALAACSTGAGPAPATVADSHATSAGAGGKAAASTSRATSRRATAAAKAESASTAAHHAAPPTTHAAAGSKQPAPSHSPTSSKPSSTAPPPNAIAPLSSVPVGGSTEVSVAGNPVVLSRPNAGAVNGFSAICTHMGCTVEAGGAQLHCPCHGSIYNAFTGAVVRGPAPKPLPPVAVHVSDGYVVSG